MRYYAYTMLVALGGGFLAAESQIFSAATASDIAFAVGIAAVVVALGATTTALAKGRLYSLLALASAGVGAWTILETLVFSDATSTWLTLGSGGALLGFSLIGLIAHERSTERVVHALEVPQEPAQRDKVPAAA